MRITRNERGLEMERIPRGDNLIGTVNSILLRYGQKGIFLKTCREHAMPEFEVKAMLNGQITTMSRSGNYAGYAYYSTCMIRLHAELLRRGRRNKTISTFMHEVAHLIAWRVAGRTKKGRGHGREWKAIMLSLGRDPTRCHDYDFIKPTNGYKAQVYECAACGYRAERSRRFSGVRYHKGCGIPEGELIYKGRQS